MSIVDLDLYYVRAHLIRATYEIAREYYGH